MHHIRSSVDSSFEVDWRYFSLEEVNNRSDQSIWDVEFSETRGTLAFLAAEAAKAQGDDAFERFRTELLRASHVLGLDINLQETIREAANAADLDGNQLMASLKDEAISSGVKESHRSAVEDHGIFGTPSFHFPNSSPVYVRIMPPPTAGEAIEIWRHIEGIATRQTSLLEIKRPTQ